MPDVTFDSMSDSRADVCCCQAWRAWLVPGRQPAPCLALAAQLLVAAILQATGMPFKVLAALACIHSPTSAIAWCSFHVCSLTSWDSSRCHAHLT